MNKKFLIISLMLIGLGLVLISQSVAYAQNNEFTVPLGDPAKRGKLKVHLNNGSVSVKGTARKDVLVRYVSPENDDDNEKENGDRRRDRNNNDNENEKSSREGLKRIGGGGMDLEVTGDNNNSILVKSNSWNHRINLELEVPSGMDLNLHTYNGGDLMVTNIEGELALSNYNGEITALNISGSVVASTYNGEIKATFDKVTENTPMSFSTFNGDVDLTFPSTLKGTFKMKTEQGEILTGFDAKVTSSGPVQTKDNKGGVMKIIIDDWKRAEINGGGPEFTIKNYHGDILIRKK